MIKKGPHKFAVTKFTMNLFHIVFFTSEFKYF